MFIKDLKGHTSVLTILCLMSVLIFGNSEAVANSSVASSQLTLEQAVQIAQNKDRKSVV